MAYVKTWPSHVLSQLYDVYNRNELCDLELVCQGEKIMVHKVLLCVSSQFIAQECKKCSGSIRVPDMEMKVLKAIIEFVYTGASNSFVNFEKKVLYTAVKKLKISYLCQLLEGKAEVVKVDPDAKKLKKCQQTIQPYYSNKKQAELRISSINAYRKYPYIYTKKALDASSSNVVMTPPRPCRFDLNVSIEDIYVPSFDDVTFETSAIFEQISSEDEWEDGGEMRERHANRNPKQYRARGRQRHYRDEEDEMDFIYGGDDDASATSEEDRRKMADEAFARIKAAGDVFANGEVGIQEEGRAEGEGAIVKSNGNGMEMEVAVEAGIDGEDAESDTPVGGTGGRVVDVEMIEMDDGSFISCGDVAHETMELFTESDPLAMEEAVGNLVSQVAEKTQAEVKVSMMEDEEARKEEMLEKKEPVEEIESTTSKSSKKKCKRVFFDKEMILERNGAVSILDISEGEAPPTDTSAIDLPPDSDATDILEKSIFYEAARLEVKKSPKLEDSVANGESIVEGVESVAEVVQVPKELVAKVMESANEVKETSENAFGTEDASADAGQFVESFTIPRELISASFMEVNVSKPTTKKNLGKPIYSAAAATSSSNQTKSMVGRVIKIKGTLPNGKAMLTNTDKLIEELRKRYPDLIKSNNVKVQVVAASALTSSSATSVTAQKPIAVCLTEEQRRKVLENKKGPWCCNDCDVTFESYAPYRKHFKDGHGLPDDSRYCRECGFYHSQPKGQIYHMVTQHGSKDRARYVFPECKKCGYIALNELSLDRHVKTHDRVTAFSSSKSPVTVAVSLGSHAANPIKCVCGASFKKNAHYLMHHRRCTQAKQTGSGNFVCECGAVFDRCVNMKAHMRICSASDKVVGEVSDEGMEEVAVDKKEGIGLKDEEMTTDEYEFANNALLDGEGGGQGGGDDGGEGSVHVTEGCADGQEDGEGKGVVDVEGQQYMCL